MTNDTIQCPVCGEKLSEYTAFCPSCSFEIHVLPNEVPQAVLEMENQRVRYAKNTLLRMKEDISRLNRQVEQKDHEIVSVKMPLEERIKTLETQNLQAAEQISKKQQEMELLSQQNRQLRIEIDEALAKSAQIASAAGQPPAFLVMSQGGNVTAIFGVLEGENSFGYAPSNERHHQILCNTQVADKHFLVKAVTETDARGRKKSKFTVSPAEGVIYGAASQANLISSEIPFEKNASIYIGDVKFTLVANKEAKTK